MADAVFLGNPGSRSGSWLDEAWERLKGQGCRRVDIDAPDQLRAALRAAVTDGVERLIVAGGDGTVTTAVQELAHTKTALGVVPMGTQNNFARGLGLPTDVSEAAQVALEGPLRSVDVGSVDGTLFANAVTVGLSGTLAAETPSGLKRVLGQAAFGLVALRELARATPFTCIIEAEGRTRHVETLQLVVSNGRGIGDAITDPGGTVSDGTLAVTTLGDGRRRSLVGAWWDARSGTHPLREDSMLLRTKGFVLRTDPVQRLDIDGELAHKTPARFWIEPSALQVAVPDLG